MIDPIVPEAVQRLDALFDIERFFFQDRVDLLLAQLISLRWRPTPWWNTLPNSGCVFER